MNIYGLIGKPLAHSFSRDYFTQKFSAEHITGAEYRNFEIASVNEFPALLLREKELRGLNVTIPYKKEIMPVLNSLETSAVETGAVNVITIDKSGKTRGFNTDAGGFGASLIDLGIDNNSKALVLGTGGSSGAVRFVLRKLNVPYLSVSRDPQKTGKSIFPADDANSLISYSDLTKNLMESHHIIINTTPAGMYQNTEKAPAVPFDLITAEHRIFDLIYNPAETMLMREAAQRGARVQGGLAMLHAQAELAWTIWNS